MRRAGIPEKIFLSAGKAGDGHPFVAKILEPGQTGVMNSYYQCHKNFDDWQTEGKYFISRIMKSVLAFAFLSLRKKFSLPFNPFNPFNPYGTI